MGNARPPFLCFPAQVISIRIEYTESRSMRVFLVLIAGALFLHADEAKEARRAHKEEARYNRQIGRQAAKDRKVLEKQRLKQGKAAGKAAHRR